MKPIDQNFVANALRWGVAGINVDGGRIAGQGWTKADGASVAGFMSGKFMGAAGHGEPTQQFGVRQSTAGRWPSNLLLDEEAAAALDEMSGVSTSNGFRSGGRRPSTHEGYQRPGATMYQDKTDWHGESDSGGASRFFYVAKASRREREAGLEIDGAWLDSIELIWHNGSTSRLSEVLLWENRGRSQSTDWSGEALPVRGIYGDTTAPQGDSDSPTSSNGNGTTGLYLTGIRFTTSTGTSATIESKTLSSLARLSTSGSTEDATRTLAAYGLSPAEGAALTSLLRRIFTSGAMVSPRGVSNAPKRTPQQTNARDVLAASRGNFHSTVKPLQLTEYLARLILPPAAYRDTARLLVPFAGSGSEMIGALRAGWRNVEGIEREAEYVEIARRRLDWWQRQMRGNDVPLPDWIGDRAELKPESVEYGA